MIELIVTNYLNDLGELIPIDREIVEIFDEEIEIAIKTTHCILKARRIRDGNFYVIKKEILNSELSRTTIINECTNADNLINRCSHSNIVKYVMDGTIRNDGSGSSPRALVMEYIEGQNLFDYITKELQRPLDKRTALNYIFQIAEALLYLHNEHNIVHRDVKPQNAMRRQEDGKVIVIDFGIAKSIGTKMHINSGTERYKPRNSLHRVTTDIYGLGMLFYFLLTGEDPPENISMSDIQKHDFGEDIELFFAKILPIKELTENDF